MAPKRVAGSESPETLDSASAHNVKGLLNRANKRRNASHTPSYAGNSGGILPPPPRRKNAAAAAAVCGAPAMPAGDAPLPTEQQNKDEDDLTIDLTQPEEEGEEEEINLHKNCGSDFDDEWQDIEEDEEEGDLADLVQKPSSSKNPSLQSGGITINVGGKRGASGNLLEDDDEAGPSRTRRQAFTKEDREIARLVHRSHLLCLLGRGLLYDAAADDSLLQATAFSLLPSSLADFITTNNSGGISSVDEQTQYKTLEEATKWFRGHFTLLKTSSLQPPAENEDEIGAAIAQAKGLEGISCQLLLVIEKRCGTAEELSTIFAALLRSLGCLIRTVRLLEPSSLKPGDALRQQEQALKNYMKRKTPSNQKQRQQNQPEKGRGGGGKLNTVAKAAAELLDGTASQRQKRYKEHIAAQLGLSDSSALKIVPGSGRGGAAPSIILDPKKLKRGGGKSGNAGEKSIGKKREVRTAVGPTDEKEKEPKIVVKKKKQRGSKEKNSKGDVLEVGKPEERKQEKGHTSGQKDGIDMVDNDINTDTDTAPAAQKSMKEERKNTHDSFCDGGVPLDAVKEKKPSSTNGVRRKRRGDEEFERELEVAMAATAFERPEIAAGQASQVTDGEKIPASATAANGNGGGSTRGAAFGSHQGHVGRYWVEVYCGSTTSGRWVHVCPISGWIDRAEDVEGLAPRGQSIAYVVAFGGHGGAKDVTRRYASSFLSAEKQREGEWWEGVLRPLRSREVAALQQNAGVNGGGANISIVQNGNNSAPSNTTTTVPNGASKLSSSPPRGPSSRLPAKKQQNNNIQKQKPASALALAALREDKELEQRAAAERLSLPTTIDGFKNHATFILARHIGKYQALLPGSKLLGMHKGEVYYNREDVGEVHTAEKWKRLGREVLIEELSNPAKKIKKRKMPQPQQQRGRGRYGYFFDSGRASSLPSPSSGAGAGAGTPGSTDANHDGGDEGGGGGGEEQEEMSNFYGIWQTKSWAPEAAVNGRVPKNERGNVEVPPFANALPAGTVHIQLPGVGPICKKLGVDYAPALTGFDIRGGRSVPAIDGIVLCTEHEAAVRAAYEEETARRAQQAKEKRMGEAEKTWRELLRALLTRVRLATAYTSNNNGGNGNNAAGNQQPQTAEGEAAIMLAHGAAQGNLKKGSGKYAAAPGSGRAVPDSAVDIGEDLVDVKVEEI